MIPETDPVPIKVLHDFAKKIESLGIEYMLTGSMAMMVYSIYRYTADVDVVIELNANQVPRMVSAFESEYYISADSALRAISNERMFNVINVATAFKVDCVIRKSSPFQTQVFERRVRKDIGGREIFVITIEDLILSKLVWAADSRSEKQMTDISNLLMADCDKTYLDEWASKLGVNSRLDECRADNER